MHQFCFEQLIRQTNPLLNEGRALSMANFLSQFKSILKDNNYKLFDSYSQTWLKQCLVKYYSSEICFSKVLGKKTYKSVCLFISLFQFLKSSNYKRELKDRELINDEPNDCKNKILKRAVNILLISDIEIVEGVTILSLDPRSISRAVISERVPS